MDFTKIKLLIEETECNVDSILTKLKLRGVVLEMEYKPLNKVLFSYDFSNFLPYAQDEKFNYLEFINGIQDYFFEQLQPAWLQMKIISEDQTIKLSKRSAGTKTILND